MEIDSQKAQEHIEKHKKNIVHRVLAHSYFFYFISFLVAVSLDIIFPIKIFKGVVMTSLGFFFLALATILIFWAQKTSLDLRKVEEVKRESFCKGPYCYTRTPTHWGLFLLMFGFGFLVNALFVIIFTLISLIVTKLVFLKKQESIMVDRYGTAYTEYKKLVKF